MVLDCTPCLFLPRMDDDSRRIASGCSSLLSPLMSSLWSEVDVLGHHALSCRGSEGRHQRHAPLNDIIHRTLASAHVPSRLESPGLNRSDGKRPDGVTTVPGSSLCGMLLVLTLLLHPMHICQATTAAGEVATHAEERKCSKYSMRFHFGRHD